MVSTYERKRGTAIVETSKGILVVRSHNAKFLLPGGGVKGGESRIEAAIRELREETSLIAYEVKHLFNFKQSKVFLIKTNGTPHPRHEIAHVGFYSPGSSLQLSFDTIQIIQEYWNIKKSR
ncbi:MAG: NUDIX domain-containing protein [Methanoregula sp.]|nr:NUDIX domain-containing protein [Methanoregula sp.]